MRLGYEKLGTYIEEVNVRNTDLAIDKLLGVSIQKILIPSIANTIGTDMSKYKVVKRNQFAYGPVTSRNGDKISIALLQDYDNAIISQSYKVFKVLDETELLPEYLMMWFRRPEFDRYTRFMSHGSTRETFDWEEMCEVELPVPSPEKQQAIVDQYNTVNDRIKLIKQLNQKLEETAQAIYKHWFVDNGSIKVSLDKYIEINPKHSVAKGVVSKYVEMANLSENSYSIKSFRNREYKSGSKFCNNDTLLARITPCLENGKTGFVDFLDNNEIAYGSTEFIVMRRKKGVSPYWVYFTARDEDFREYAISSMVGSSGRQRVDSSYLDDYQVEEVEDKQMASFHAKCETLFLRMKNNSSSNRKLRILKSNILSMLAQLK